MPAPLQWLILMVVLLIIFAYIYVMSNAATSPASVSQKEPQVTDPVEEEPPFVLVHTYRDWEIWSDLEVTTIEDHLIKFADGSWADPITENVRCVGAGKIEMRNASTGTVLTASGNSSATSSDSPGAQVATGSLRASVVNSRGSQVVVGNGNVVVNDNRRAR